MIVVYKWRIVIRVGSIYTGARQGIADCTKRPAPKKQVPVISVLHDHGHPGLCLKGVTYTSRWGRRSVLVELSMCGEKILVYLAAR
jgi:hypothetical protein